MKKLNVFHIGMLIDLLESKEYDVRENFDSYSFTEKEADAYQEELREIKNILNDMYQR